MKEVPWQLCVLFAEVSGTARVYERLGDGEALRAVERCLNRMERATAACKGRVVKANGELLIAAFDTAEAGLAAATEMQQRIDALPPVSGITLAIRVGLHLGPALEDNGELFGEAVQLTSRILGRAEARQILLTAEMLAALPEALQKMMHAVAPMPVKGSETGLPLFEARWGVAEEAESSVRRPPVAAETRLRLSYGDQQVVLGPDRPTASFGRDTKADIVIQDARASRSHGRIECRRDKFVLVDQSTNGTYVNVRGEREFVVKREEAVLRGCGHIAFGHADNNVLMEFEVI